MRRIVLRGLYQPVDTQTWSYDDYGNPQYVPPTSSPLEYALALGVSHTLLILFQAPMATENAAALTDDDVFWMQVRPGSAQYGSLYGAEAAADLLMDSGVWQGMVDQQYRLLSTLDRWIEQLEASHEPYGGGHQGGRGRPRPPTGPCWRRSASRPSARRRPTRTPRTPPASWSPARPGSPSPSPRRAAPRATGSTRWSGSRSPRASAPVPYASTAAGGATTWPAGGPPRRVGLPGRAAVAARRRGRTAVFGAARSRRPTRRSSGRGP